MKDAKKILFDQFWDTNGWKNLYKLNVTEEEFSYAKEKGFMFDYPDVISHQEYLDRLNHYVSTIKRNMLQMRFCSA